MSDRYGLTTIATELHDNGVLVATLNRPEHRNSLDRVMHVELKQLYETIVDDEELNAVVLTGAGKYFCVGADFNSMEENVSYPDGHPGLLDRLGRHGAQHPRGASPDDLRHQRRRDRHRSHHLAVLRCRLHGGARPDCRPACAGGDGRRATAARCCGRCSWARTEPRST